MLSSYKKAYYFGIFSKLRFHHVPKTANQKFICSIFKKSCTFGFFANT